jgi:hypothetical protein
MNLIFEGTEEVIVWLGPAFKDNDELMFNVSTQAYGEPSLEQSSLVQTVLSRLDYWKRVLVRQEFVLADSFIIFLESRFVVNMHHDTLTAVVCHALH